MLRRHLLPTLAGAAVSPAAGPAPDHILINGRIYAGPALELRQALAIAGDRIFAVGSNEEIRALSAAGTRRTDLAGSTVLPGFIDSHTHVASSGLNHLLRVDCDLRSIEQIQRAIRERAAKTPVSEWVLGFKYDDTKTREGRKLTKADLDAAAPEHPVLIQHRGGHTSYANSRALEKSDIHGKTPNPSGGEIVRDGQGRLTGELRETAARLVRVQSKPPTVAERREGVKLITKLFARAGITSAHDAQGSPEDLRAYQDALENGDLFCRVYALINFRYIDQMIAAGVRTGLGNEWVRVGAMKMTADGSISERTARLSQPYIGRPNDYGIVVMPENELYETGRKAHLAGWQIGTHANGDVGIDITLRVYERLQREHPRSDPRFRLEHCTLINDNLLARMKALRAIPTPFWTYVHYHGEKMREYGPERLERMFAMRSFLDHGIRVAPGSDYVPGPFEPMMALQSSVTRRDSKGTLWGGSQRITVAEAIRASTQNGAYASFEERIKGTLEAGKLADLAVLGRDPFQADPGSLIQIPVERTMAGGRWMYES
ncbi:MAG: amidohydrolase [Acidobacteria bacterium]|nr:amidohydrolase [Acidobacteriota bacterium]